jgi:hypothetical protein
MRRWKKLRCNPNCTTPKYLESRGSWRNSQSLKQIWVFSKTKPENVRILACTEIPKIPDLGPLRVPRYVISVLRYTPKCPNSAVPFLKMLECVSGFENFAKIFWNQDIQMWHNLDCILKIFRSKSFFVHLNCDFNRTFMETCDLQKSSATEAQLWIWQPRCKLKGLKVDNLLE